MTTPPCPVYLFRSAGFAPSGDTVVSVAPVECVIAVYGNGGVVGEGGLSSAFGGAVVFRNDASKECFIGVWGARNASRFRRELRTHMQITVHREAPDARLVFWGSEKERPKHSLTKGVVDIKPLENEKHPKHDASTKAPASSEPPPPAHRRG